MVKGLILVGWDDSIGCVVDATYPQTFLISHEIINKILMTHQFSTESEPELLEIKYKNYIIFSYCDKRNIPEHGHEMVMLVLDQHEEKYVNLYSLRKLLMEHISEFESGERSNRVQNFYDFAKKFYQKRSSKKVLIIGPPSSGKTSIKKVFFEGIDSEELLRNNLEPTRGFSHYVYKWLDMELGVADSSGQELNYYLSKDNSFEQDIAFEAADVVIYNFDFPFWEDYADLVIENLERISEISKSYNVNCKVFAFCHKSDLMPGSQKPALIKEIGSKIKSKFRIPVYFTSILPERIATLYKALQTILGEVSPLSTQIENILSGVIGTSDKTIALVLNREQSIINQHCSTNYNFTIGMIMKEYYYKANEYLNKIHNNRIETATIIGTEVLNVYIKSLSFIHKDVDSIVLVSESLSKVDLIRCATEIGQELKLLKNQQESILEYS